jgi:hypothetical protein
VSRISAWCVTSTGGGQGAGGDLDEDERQQVLVHRRSPRPSIQAPRFEPEEGECDDAADREGVSEKVERGRQKRPEER